MKKHKNLSDFSSILQSVNIRKPVDVNNYFIGGGIGKEGDVVLVQTLATEKPFSILGISGETFSSEKHNYILAVLGNRHSSTHANGGIPKKGLTIIPNQKIDWLGGASGVVGICEETTTLSTNTIEGAFKIKLIGLVKNDTGNLNIMEFSIRPVQKKLKLPVILISGTSAEAGKTTLMKNVLSFLSEHTKIAALKITGTGGMLDCNVYKNAGAHFTADQVDCGLITTYTQPKHFEDHIQKAFLAAQESGCQLILAELGGDLPGANNPALLKAKFLIDHIHSLIVINNDAMSIMGSQAFLKKIDFKKKVFHFSSPFRNYVGMKSRANYLEPCSLHNILDAEHIRRPFLKFMN
jgi:hypothetical protein